MAREYQLTTTSRIGAIAIGVVLLAVVGFFLAFGFVLIVGLAIAGAVLGVGAALRRKLTGAPVPTNRSTVPSRHGLDPAKEIRPDSAPPPRVGDRTTGEKDTVK